MADIAPEATVLILADFEPLDKLGLFFWGQGVAEGGETGEGPVAARDF